LRVSAAAAGIPTGTGPSRPAGAGPPADPADPAGVRHRPALWSLRLNPLAAVPYLIGTTIIALEVLHHA
jgi:hypothetical protein